MKTIARHFVLFLSLLFIAVSCNNNDDDNNNTIGPQAVKYEVIGNFSGELDATFNRNTDEGEAIKALPWTKEFITAQGTTGVTLIVDGIGGVAGQTLTLKIYVGGVVKKEFTATASSNGNIMGFRSYNF